MPAVLSTYRMFPSILPRRVKNPAMLVCGLFMAAILVAPSLQQVTCNMSNRFESCTEGFCCARDDFQLQIIYCKKIGYEGEHCSTRPSSFDCPCHDELYCKPNIAGHLHSLYGTCRRDKATNNMTSATTTTTSKPGVPLNIWNNTDQMFSDITTGGITFPISTHEQASEPSTQDGHGQTTSNTSTNTQSQIVG